MNAFLYECQIINAKGQERSQQIKADSKEEARQKIEAKGGHMLHCCLIGKKAS